MSADPATVLDRAAAMATGRLAGRAAMATVVGRTGSAPQIVGARLLLDDRGRIFGTVGGGALEARTLEVCRRVLSSRVPERISFHLVRDLGMCCGGTMDVFVEPVEAAPRLCVIGAGHVGRAVAKMARVAGWQVIVVDDRETELASPDLTGCDLRPADADELATVLSDLRPEDHVLVVTRDHARDERALDDLLDRPLAYLGMIGSRRKVHRLARRIVERRRALGRPIPRLDHVRAPVGLDLGGHTPGEIAVSIMAELLALRSGREPRSLSCIGEAFARAMDATCDDADAAGRSDAVRASPTGDQR